MGALVLTFAHFFTHSNPYAMGITTFAVYMIGHKAGDIQFNPLITSVSYFMGRTPAIDSVYLVMSQYIAAALVFITFQPLKVFIDQA